MLSGIKPCPRCGSLRDVRLQTPVEKGMVNRAFFRCFACDLASPDYPGWAPVRYPEHGGVSVGPLKQFWNEWTVGEGVR